MRRIIAAAICVIYLFSSLPLSIHAAESASKKRVLIINSYHKGFKWSDDICDAIVDYFNKHLPGRVEIKLVYMDTKRNNSEEFGKNAGVKIKKLIDLWKPDVVIGSDDSVAKYVIAPYFLNSDIPFVFCGLNGDPKDYGFPASNVTGLRESDLVEPLYNDLKKFARGKRLGYLTADKETQRIMAEVNEKQIGQKFDKVYFAKNFEEWKKYFLIIQNEVDILLMQDVYTVNDWDAEAAQKFVRENIRIPNGATSDVMSPYVLICIYKSSKEHGLWAAEAALKILNGAKPKDIPIATNKKGYLVLNLVLADKLDIVFSPTMLRAAKLIITDKIEKKK